MSKAEKKRKVQELASSETTVEIRQAKKLKVTEPSKFGYDCSYKCSCGLGL